MKPQTTLVRSEGTVHLDPESTVDVYLSLVIDPRHTEHDHPLGLDDALHDPAGAVTGVTLNHRPE